MGKDFAACAEGVLAAVGGAGNVRSNMACMTRLRIQVADASAVDVEALKGVDGVMHVVEDGDRRLVEAGPDVVVLSGAGARPAAGAAGNPRPRRDAGLFEQGAHVRAGGDVVHDGQLLHGGEGSTSRATAQARAARPSGARAAREAENTARAARLRFFS